MINRRPSKLFVNKTFKDSETITESLNNLSDLQYAICPFDVILGVTNTTEAGIKNIAYKPSNYSDMAKAFNGKGSVLLEWLNSTDLKQVKNDIPYTKDAQTGELEENNYWETLFKVGTVFKGFLTNSSIETIFTPSTFNEETVALEITETINLTIIPPKEDGTGWEQNTQFIEDIVNNGFRFYTMPNIFDDIYTTNNPNSQDPKESDRNLYKDSNKKRFYITGANAIYNKQTQKISYMEVAFASVNDKIAKSGLADNQYLQNSAPGDAYAFPKWDDVNKKIILDPVYLEPAPITHAQVGVYGNFAYTSIFFEGRPIRIIKDAEGNIIGKKILSPRILAPYKYQAPEYNNLYFTPTADANYFSVIDAKPTLQEYAQTWKQNFQELYNIPAGKISNFDGVFATDETKTLATNQATAGANNKLLPFWDISFGVNSNFWNDKAYGVEGSELFYCLAPGQNDFTKPTGIKTFNPTNLETKNFANWNFINMTIFKQFPQLPEAITQITPISLISLPVVGGFLNKFTLGLGLGWKSVNNLSQPDAFPVPMLLPTETYIFGSSTMKQAPSGATGVDGLIPFDLLKNGTIDAPENAVGVNKKLCSFAFNLTDRAVMRPADVNTVYNDQNPNNNTPKLTLLNDRNQYVINDDGTQDKTKIMMVDEKFNLQEPNTVGWEDYKVGFIIDKVFVLGGNKSKYDVTFFSQTHDINGNVNSDDSVWYGRYESTSLKTKTIRSWANTIATSNPLWKLNIPPFPYPTNVRQATPDNTSTYEQEILFNTPTVKTQSGAIVTDQNWTNGETSDITGTNYQPVTTTHTFTSINDFDIPTGYNISNLEIDIQTIFNNWRANIETVYRLGNVDNFDNVIWSEGEYGKQTKQSLPWSNGATYDYKAPNNTLFNGININGITHVSKIRPPSAFFPNGYDLNIVLSIVANKLQVQISYTYIAIKVDNGYEPYGSLFASSTVKENLVGDIQNTINSLIVNFQKI